MSETTTVYTPELSPVEAGEHLVLIPSKNGGIRLGGDPDAGRLSFEIVGTDGQLTVLEDDGSETTVTFALFGMQSAIDSSVGDFKIVKANGETLTLNDLQNMPREQWDEISRQNIYVKPVVLLDDQEIQQEKELIRKEAEELRDQARKEIEQVKQQAEEIREQTQQEIEEAKREAEELKEQAEREAQEARQEAEEIKEQTQKEVQEILEVVAEEYKQAAEVREDARSRQELDKDTAVRKTANSVEQLGNLPNPAENVDGIDDPGSVEPEPVRLFLDTTTEDDTSPEEFVEPPEEPEPAFVPVSVELAEESDTSARDNITSSRAIKFRGEAESGEVIRIFVDGKEVGTAVAKSDNTWEFDTSGLTGANGAPLFEDEGLYNVAVLRKSAKTEEPEASMSVVRDNSIERPEFTFDDARNGLNTNATEFDVSLKGEPGAIILLRPEFAKDGAEEIKVTLDKEGKGTARLSLKDIADADGKIAATVVDIAGNVRTFEYEYALDRSDPSLSLELGEQSRGLDPSYTSEKAPEFTGKSESFALVNVEVRDADGNVVYSDQVEADADGNWALEPDPQKFAQGYNGELPDGGYTLAATAVDQAGNSSSETTMPFTVDTVDPDLVWQIQEPSDSGVKGDYITNVKSPAFDGEATPGSVVRIVVTDASGEIVYAFSAPVDGNGRFNFRLDDIKTGNYQISVTATDKAGNVTEVERDIEIDRDTDVSLKLTEESDSGVKGDFITNDTTPQLELTVEPGSQFDLKILDENGNPVSGVTIGETVDASGARLVTVSELADGQYTVVMTSTDVAGNNVQKTQILEVDTVSKLDWRLSEESDSGVKGDFITNDNKPVLEVFAEPKSKIEVTVYDSNGQLVTGFRLSEENEGGVRQVAFDKSLPDGKYSITVKSTDAAGNEVSETHIVEVDTQDPETPVLLTNDEDLTEFAMGSQTALFSSAAVEEGSTVELIVLRRMDDGTVQEILRNQVPLNDDRTWSYRFNPSGDPATFPAGDYVVVQRVTDTAGNSSDDRVRVKLDYDTEPPTLRVSEDSDTGRSSEDAITSNQSPLVEGTSEPNSTVYLTLRDENGIVGEQQIIPVGRDGTWKHRYSDLPENNYKVDAYSRDAAGNRSPTSTLDMEIDTTPPEEIPPAYNDGEAVYTNEGQFSFKGTDVPAGYDVEVVLYDTDGKAVYSAIVPRKADGSWKHSPPAALEPGDYEIGTRYIDTAGNKSDESPRTFLSYSEAPPEVPTDIKLFVGDQEDADWIVNHETPALRGQTDPDNITKVIVDYIDPLTGKPVRVTSDDPGGVLVLNADGSWRMGLDFSTLDSNKKVPYEVSYQDKYGNVSQKQAVEVTYDSVVEMPNPLFDEDTKTGVSNEETASQRPTFDFHGGEKVTLTSVRLLDENGNVLAELKNIIDPDKLDFWAGGAYDQDLPDGNYRLEYTARDVAGNTEDGSFDFKVDNVKPDAPEAAHYVGSEETSVSNDMTPYLKGTTEPGAEVRVYDGDPANGGKLIGTVRADEKGFWELEPAQRLEDYGRHDFYVISQDTAGNDSEPTVLELDLLERDIPPGDIYLVNPVQYMGQYYYGTNKPVLKLVGLLPGAVNHVVVKNGDEIIYQGPIVTKPGQTDYYFNLPGNIQLPLSEGMQSLSMVVTDAYGNESDLSARATFTIDTTAPQDPAPEITNSTQTTPDGDDALRTRTVEFGGTAEPRSRIEVQVRRKGETEWQTFDDTVADENGRWDMSSDILAEDGEYEYRAKSTDPANNESYSDIGKFVIDTTVEHGTIQDKSVNSAIHNFEMAMEEGTTVSLLGLFKDGVAVPLPVGENGTMDGDSWKFNLKALLGLTESESIEDGHYTLRMGLTDRYGNYKETQETVEYKSTMADLGVDGATQAAGGGQEIITDSLTPVLSGTAEPGTSLKLLFVRLDNGQLLGQAFEVPVKENGKWQADLADMADILEQTDLTMIMQVEDDYGNQIDESMTLDYTGNAA
ncbi:Ig-like domain-containing protein [Kiloniella sp. b19]|uniref:Ig-like domain-containing protein n=1 Tax=Kiloniella sp. GXU_MW_B19 TaxID=3141326 RepID=UPI0031D3BF8D